MKTKNKILLVLFVAMIIISSIGIIFESIAASKFSGLKTNDKVHVGYGDLKNNSNLYCVQHGGRLYSSGYDYTVDSTGTINTKNTSSKVASMLAYILNYDNSSRRNGAKGCEDNDPAQQALWKLIKENRSNVKSTLGMNHGTLNGKEGLSSAAQTLYNDAEEFAEYINQRSDNVSVTSNGITGNSTNGYVLKYNVNCKSYGKFGGVDTVIIKYNNGSAKEMEIDGGKINNRNKYGKFRKKRAN